MAAFLTAHHASDVVNVADFIATAAAAAVSVTNSSGLILGSELNDPFASRATVGPGADEGAAHTACCLLNLRQRDNKPSGRSFSITQTPHLVAADAYLSRAANNNETLLH